MQIKNGKKQNAHAFLQRVRRFLRILKAENVEEYTLKMFRAGKATAMAAEGASLGMILAAGEWRSNAFLNYVNEEKAETLACKASMDTKEMEAAEQSVTVAPVPKCLD